MSHVRRFLIAPSLARLVRKERGSARITEGYFPPQPGRSSLIRVEGAQSHLVLVTDGAAAGAEERTEVPRPHAEALLDVCAGKGVYERSRLPVGQGREAMLDHYTSPGQLDLVSVTFDSAEDARAFSAPAWFGPEITDAPEYEGRSIAIQGVPQGEEVAPTNAGLNALLDQFESRFGTSRFGQAARLTTDDPRVMDAMRRLAATTVVPGTRPWSIGSDQGMAASAVARAEAPQAVIAPAVAASAPEAAAEEAAPGAASTAEEVAPEPTAEAAAAPAAPATGTDARLDQMLENLSQALETAGAEGEREPEEASDTLPSYERWSVRARSGGE